jgi:hypothetical protein
MDVKTGSLIPVFFITFFSDQKIRCASMATVSRNRVNNVDN